MRRLIVPAALVAALVFPASASASLPVPIPDVASPNAVEAIQRNIDRFSSLPVPIPDVAKGKGRINALLVLKAKLDAGVIIIDPSE